MNLKASLLAILVGMSVCSVATAHPTWRDAMNIEAEGDEYSMKAKHRRHGKRLGMLAKLERALKKLDLSEQQKAQIQTIKTNNRDSHQANRRQSYEYRIKMQELLEATDVDANAVKTLAVEIAEHRANMLLQGVQVRDQALALLTSEQLEALETMKAKRAEKRAKRRAEFEKRLEN